MWMAGGGVRGGLRGAGTGAIPQQNWGQTAGRWGAPPSGRGGGSGVGLPLLKPRTRLGVCAVNCRIRPPYRGRAGGARHAFHRCCAGGGAGAEGPPLVADSALAAGPEPG